MNGKKRMKILYLTNIPSPYRVDYFNELGKRCELTVIFEKATSTERDNSWKKYSFNTFSGIILNGISLRADAAFCPQIINYLRKDIYDFIIITNMSSLTGLLAIAWLKLFKIPYCIEGDGAFAVKKSGLKTALKAWAISSAKMCFSTSVEHDKYYFLHGTKKENIIRYPFTSVYEKAILDTPLNSAEKEKIRKEMGITEKVVLLSVGSYIHRKGFDILIRAMANISQEIGVYLIGGSPTDEYLRLQEKYGLKNLHFLPFQRDGQLNKFYDAADFFLHPTREDIWGLVINEAMAHALPVVTTDRCIAGMELVKDAYNGYIVEHDNALALTECLEKMLNEKEQWYKYSENALKTACEYTIEQMVKIHVDTFEKKLR